MRVGLAGLGGIAALHARNLVALEGVELVALASSDPDRARSFASEHAPDARACSYEELFAADDVDGVVVTSRSTEHAAHGAAAIRAGKHLFLEKPGATTLADHALLDEAAAEEPSLVVHVAYNRRYDAEYRAAHDTVSAGAIGQPLMVLLTSRDAELPEGEDPRETGGFLLDMAAHDYDLACWLLGQEPVEVYAARQALVHPQLEEVGDLDNAVVTVRFDGGGLAATHISRTSAYGHDIRGEILGTEGSVLVGNPASRDGVTVLGAGDRESFPPTYADRFADSFKAELSAFVDACRGRGPRGPGLEDDRRAVSVAVAARASAVQGRALAVGEDWPWP